MENWIFYAGVAAFLIAMRDIFTKKFTNKYSTIEDSIAEIKEGDRDSKNFLIRVDHI